MSFKWSSIWYNKNVKIYQRNIYIENYSSGIYSETEDENVKKKH